MIFGRGGEEIQRLRDEAIPVEVVPGITAASGFAARLGRSLTHRDSAHSVRFVTGHSRSGGLPEDLDWTGLADAHTTVVFYMAGRTANAIAERLICKGLQPSTPVIVATSISRADERFDEMTVGDLRNYSCDPSTAGPALIAIGNALQVVERSQEDASADFSSSVMAI